MSAMGSQSEFTCRYCFVKLAKRVQKRIKFRLLDFSNNVYSMKLFTTSSVNVGCIIVA